GSARPPPGGVRRDPRQVGDARPERQARGHDGARVSATAIASQVPPSLLRASLAAVKGGFVWRPPSSSRGTPQFAPHLYNQLLQARYPRHPVTCTNDVHISFPPVPLWTAHHHLAATSEQAQFQQGDRGSGARGEVHRDDRGQLLGGQLPLDLLAKLRIG